jgi:AbrB family looped-hinge helix DNA binding protein
MAVSVTSKGQVTIPKKVRDALGITPGSKVDFYLENGGARLKLITRHVPSSLEEGPVILDYRGPRIPIREMHGGLAMSKATKRARRAARLGLKPAVRVPPGRP